MKHVLIVAFHFPPFAASSGIQRTLRFVQYLPAFGWQPIVLTAHPRAYETTRADLLEEIPAGTIVERAQAWDTARHLSIAGRYPGFLSRPDRWLTWRFAAVSSGMRLIRKLQPKAIWSTYPIATAHSIGAELQERSGLPWIADFRDPMAQEGYPADPRVWRSFKDIERVALHHARFSVFCTPGAKRMYGRRYPDLQTERLCVIENGYDEGAFADIEARGKVSAPLAPGALTLLHSGIVYPKERDPTQFFAALGELKRAMQVSAEKLRVRFRAAGHDDLLRGLATRYDVLDLVEIEPAIAYGAALEEMMRADALLVMQAANCNDQIPAKLYEYLRAGRPIIGLTDPEGDTGIALRSAGIDSIAPLDSTAEIVALLQRVLYSLACGKIATPGRDVVQAMTREERCRELAKLLEIATT